MIKNVKCLDECCRIILFNSCFYSHRYSTNLFKVNQSRKSPRSIMKYSGPKSMNLVLIQPVTFSELGGDSMMVIIIDAANRIMKAARSKKGLNLAKHQIITANDLFENTILSIYYYILNGKDGPML